MTTRGRITIPKEIRDKLDLTPGTLVEFSVNDGVICMRPVKKVTDNNIGSAKNAIRKR